MAKHSIGEVIVTLRKHSPQILGFISKVQNYNSKKDLSSFNRYDYLHLILIYEPDIYVL